MVHSVPTIAAYYFPNYHSDARNALTHGPGWNEWELVRRARPRFPGHRQPNCPLWGYGDEADPRVMEQKIAAAADHGVDVFIYDWYYYNDGTFLERALNEGFFGAANRSRLRYALMWANHNWVDIHPVPADLNPELLYPGAVTPESFERMTDYVIEHHFSRPEYWRIAGAPYFSIYELYRIAESFGGWNEAAAALERFREKARSAGFPGIHLNGVLWGLQLLPGEQTISDPAALVKLFGLDSVTSYVWVHHARLERFPVTPYAEVFAANRAYWDSAASTYAAPYFPNVTMGWDASPRTLQETEYTDRGYPYMATMSTTPEEFGAAIRAACDFVAARPPEQRVVTINAWNEWTEGSYLEPDEFHRFAYLEAIREAKAAFTDEK